MSAPPGWHLQDDGRERFWDGQQWTEQFRTPAGSDPTAPPPPEQSGGQISAILTSPAAAVAKRMVFTCDRDLSGFDWPGSPLFDANGKVVGVYSRLTPPPQLSPVTAVVPDPDKDHPGSGGARRRRHWPAADVLAHPTPWLGLHGGDRCRSGRRRLR